MQPATPPPTTALHSSLLRATDRLGVQAGGEFVSAAAAANAVGAQLVLGDRPVEITLQRAWDALPWGRRGALLLDLARGALAPLPQELSAEVGRGWGFGVWGVVHHVLRVTDVQPSHSHRCCWRDSSHQMVESLKTDGAVSSMFALLGQRYPELVAPLVSERDLYLAWSLKRSKAVNGASRVVGVIGKGHLQVRCGCMALVPACVAVDLLR
jgi:pheromone shutdown protein TraB